MSGISLRIRGKDTLGEWNAHEGTCLVCGKKGLVMRYRRRWKMREYKAITNDPDVAKRYLDVAVYKDLTWDVILRSTILGKAYPNALTHGQGAGSIGITCGCYATFMRQLTHIVERWKGPGRDEQRERTGIH